MPSNAQVRLDLERFLPYRLSVLSNRVSNAIARHYSNRFGLSIAQWRVMAVLGQDSGLPAREVALRTEMDKVQVSRAVTNLVRRKIVQKQSDASDRRVTRLALTRSGRAIYGQIVPLALAFEKRFLAALAPDERETLEGLLSKLAIQARELGASSASPSG
jgi:DNA-binding MarR family transcriptional regulator